MQESNICAARKIHHHHKTDLTLKSSLCIKDYLWRNMSISFKFARRSFKLTHSSMLWKTLVSSMSHNILTACLRSNEIASNMMKILNTHEKNSRTSCWKLSKTQWITRKIQVSIWLTLISTTFNLFKILLIIWTCCKINYILKLKILMLNKLSFYTFTLRMRFIRKATIMQTFSKNTMNIWIILLIWKKMSIRLQIEKLMQVCHLLSLSEKKTLCQQVHCFCINKKHEHSVMTVFTALKLNVKLTHFIIILKMIIHHSKEFWVYHALFDMRAEQNFISQLLIKKKNLLNI